MVKTTLEEHSIATLNHAFSIAVLHFMHFLKGLGDLGNLRYS